MSERRDAAPACPLPLAGYEVVQLAHGGGGTLMRRLLEDVFARAFAAPELDMEHDAARLALAAGQDRVVFTTDSYVVRPLFFPGGDIGALAVHGTANDLAMAGARPRWLSAGFVLEEGLPLADLRRIVASMRRAADAIGVRIVTGDTKVVERGKGDGVYVNTAGVGEPLTAEPPSPRRLRAGDAVLVSGDLGRHGAAIMMARERLGFAGEIASDLGDLSGLVQALLAAGIEPRCLRDLTRGGLAAAVCEIAAAAGREVEIAEPAVPVAAEVRAFCEVLGLDPLHVANEGRLVAFVPAAQAERALAVMRAHPMGAGAVLAGRVTAGEEGRVVLAGALGARRLLVPLSGEQLPRIC